MSDHRNDAMRYRQSMNDWYWITAEAEAADRRDREREADLAGRPHSYRPGRMIAATVALLAASVTFALVLEYYLRGLS